MQIHTATSAPQAIQLTQLKGVGDAQAQLFHKLQVYHILDLLFFLPRSYEDRTRVVPIRHLRVGQPALIEAVVVGVDYPAGRKPSLAVQVKDASGNITLRFYHVYKGLAERFNTGTLLRIFGEPRIGSRGVELYHPEFTNVRPQAPLTKSALTAIYPLTEGLTQAKVRLAVSQALKIYNSAQIIINLLPPSSQFLQLSPQQKAILDYNLSQALHTVHAPDINEPIDALLNGTHPSQQRLALEELTAHQLSMLTRRQFLQAIQAPACAPSIRLAPQLLQQLPFKPTGAQQRVVTEISKDLQSNKAMLRLVQGDVGSGKTLVAALAACQALEAGLQVAFMAPTEILAEQHFINLDRWFAPLGIKTTWLAGKLKGKKRDVVLEEIVQNQAQLIIGTHAMFQDHVQFAHLGLVIIDEQHRFGVDQRLALRDKGVDGSPHQLIMTATPIPRTLTMSMYGDLDTSVINELPPGRTPIQTVAIPIERKDEVISRIAANCSQGKQAYWVCTLVEESETLDVQAAEETYKYLQQHLPQLSIGLVHGKMHSNDKQKVMQAFKHNQLHVLVATTVIEVGVDVPNASLMIIENAERLGLSQLHQLRGRVGRGSQSSFCVLMYKGPLSEHAKARINILRQSTDGFIIAEQDLQLRGPGELLGTRQTGDLGFKVAQLQRDEHLLPLAQQLAQYILKQQPQNADLLLQRWLAHAPKYTLV